MQSRRSPRSAVTRAGPPTAQRSSNPLHQTPVRSAPANVAASPSPQRSVLTSPPARPPPITALRTPNMRSSSNNNNNNTGQHHLRSPNTQGSPRSAASPAALSQGRAMIERMQHRPSEMPNAFTVPIELVHLYPEALRSPLSDKYSEPVIGTAVIDRVPTEGPLEDVLEMVSPMPSTTIESMRQLSRKLSMRSPLLSPTGSIAAASLGGGADGDEDDVVTADVSSTASHVYRLPSASEYSTASFGTVGRVVVAPEAMQTTKAPRHVLRKGGFIIFSDDFVAQNPETDFAAVSNDFKVLSGGSPSTSPTQPNFSATPPNNNNTNTNNPNNFNLEEDMAIRTQLHSYITEVEAQQRPLFRRVSSARKYGRGLYYSSNASFSGSDHEQ